MWMRKFEGLLPEVYRRRLYKRRGFSSIHEFAAKMAGMSHNKVDKILRLSKRLEDKPTLKTLFEEGEVPYTKLELVSYAATVENEQEWAEKVITQPRIKLEREIKSLPGKTFEKTQPRTISLQLDPETEKKLLALQQKLSQTKGEAQSLGEVIKGLVDDEHKEMKKTRNKTVQRCPDCVRKRALQDAEKSETTRYVRTAIRDLVMIKQNYSCATSHCLRPPAELHHLDGYAITKSHDPERLRYLCSECHHLQHASW